MFSKNSDDDFTVSASPRDVGPVGVGARCRAVTSELPLETNCPVQWLVYRTHIHGQLPNRNKTGIESPHSVFFCYKNNVRFSVSSRRKIFSFSNNQNRK
jgi:hypothetical protein